MSRSPLLVIVLVVATSPLRGEPIPDKYKPMIQKGLAYLSKEQNKDGSWAAAGGQYPVAVTGLAGVALLMEGSTVNKGKYKDQIRRATDWLIARSQKGKDDDGLIGDRNNAAEGARYMFGHGFAVMFLSCVFAEEDNRERRLALKDVLQRAVRFTAKAQSSNGGWFYVAAGDANDLDEGAATLAQVQGLRAAQSAGIVLPKNVLKNGRDYLVKYTSPAGGVYYSPKSTSERPALTAGAMACAFSAAEYEKQPAVKKWLEFCQRTIPLAPGGRMGFDEYLWCYYAQAIYALGDKGHAKLLPDATERLQWSKVRETLFANLQRSQADDGSWSATVGPVYATALYLTALQLDNEAVPIISAKME